MIAEANSEVEVHSRAKFWTKLQLVKLPVEMGSFLTNEICIPSKIFWFFVYLLHCTKGVLSFGLILLTSLKTNGSECLCILSQNTFWTTSGTIPNTQVLNKQQCTYMIDA